jgi:hypothetical protein
MFPNFLRKCYHFVLVTSDIVCYISKILLPDLPEAAWCVYTEWPKSHTGGAVEGLSTADTVDRWLQAMHWTVLMLSQVYLYKCFAGSLCVKRKVLVWPVLFFDHSELPDSTNKCMKLKCWLRRHSCQMKATI